MNKNFQEFNNGLEKYTARIEGLRNRFIEIGAKIGRLEGQKASALIAGDDSVIKRIDSEIDDLQRESGNIQMTLLLLPSKASDNFHTQADELKKNLVKDFEAVQERYNIQVENVLKAKEAYLKELEGLGKIQLEAAEINQVFYDAKTSAESLKGDNVPKKSFYYERVGRLREIDLMPNSYTGQDASEVVGIPETLQRTLYTPLL